MYAVIYSTENSKWILVLQNTVALLVAITWSLCKYLEIYFSQYVLISVIVTDLWHSIRTMLYQIRSTFSDEFLLTSQIQRELY